MLNRGANSLIHVYSSCRDSNSEPTTVHCTAAAVVTMARVLGASWCSGAKYEDSLLRRFLALPT